MSKPILVSGSLAYDRIMDFDGYFRDHFIAEGLHNINVSFLVSPPNVEFGGCAGNIAYTLSLFKESVDIVDSAGNDFERYRVRLSELGVNTDTIQTYDDMPTASAYIMTDKDDNQITAFSEGASARSYEKEIDVKKYDIAILGTASIETTLRVAHACKEAGTPYIFDPSQKLTAFSGEELRECTEGAKILIVNDYELKMLCEKTEWSEPDLLTKVETLVVTLGKNGSRVVTKDGEENVPAVGVEKIIDPTGAGDAYRAGFLKGYIREKSLVVCAKMGSIAAAYAIECYGTQNHTFTKDEFDARYLTTHGESLPGA